MRKLKIGLALALIIGATFFVLNNLSATLVLRWLAAKTGAPITIRSASWRFSWSGFFKQHRIRDIRVSGDLKDLGKAFEIKTSLEYSKVNSDEGKVWAIKVFPEVRIEGMPPFSGNIAVHAAPLHPRVDFDIVGLEPIGPVKNWKTKGFAAKTETWHVEADLRLSELELKSKSFPLKIATIPASVKLEVQKEKIAPIEIHVQEPLKADFFGEYFFGGKKIAGKIRTKIALQKLVNEIIVGTLTDADKIGDLPILNRASAKGSLSFAGLLEWTEKSGISVHGKSVLAAETLEFPSRDLYLDGIRAELPTTYPGKAESGVLSVRSLEFRRIKTKPFSLDLRIDETSLEIGARKGAIEQAIWGSTAALSKLHFFYPWSGSLEFDMALQGGPFQLSDIQRDLCISPSRPLKGQIAFNYPRIQQDKSHLSIKGSAEMEIFSGKVHTGDIDVYLGEADPLLYFDVIWDDLDLGAIGEWTKFGDMRGSLNGSIKDAKVALSSEGVIPVAYDLRIEGAERGGNKIRFFGRAINNVLELLSVKKDEMPFFAKWVIDLTILVRNWMPVVVNYMGFRATSDGEWTKITTFDPEPGSSAFEALKKDQNHYILYGTYFKIPLQTSGVYPVVMKADAFQGWLTGMKDYFGTLSNKGEETNECSNQN